MQNRAKLRGRKLDKDCHAAKTSRHEYGLQDDRVFCYGTLESMTEELLKKCEICGALVYNSSPLQKE